MTRTTHKILFLPSNKEINVSFGSTLIDAAIDSGIHINVSCGGKGICGKCRVEIKKGEVEGGINEKLSYNDLENNIKLACKAKVVDNLVVNVPTQSSNDSIVSDEEHSYHYTTRIKKTNINSLKEKGFFIPTVEKFFLQMSKPTNSDRLPDVTRIVEHLKLHMNERKLNINLNVIRKIPDVIRNKNFCITATIVRPVMKEGRSHLINIQSGDTTNQNLAIAMDIGTTTIYGQLIDLKTGYVLHEYGNINKQISYGEDVISRIIFTDEKGGLEKINKALVDTINKVIYKIVNYSNISSDNISIIAFAGNTTMTQLLLKINPKQIRLSPYVPASTFYPVISSKELGIILNDYSMALVYPSVSSYVGGDIVAGIIGSEMYTTTKLTLFIDIGTNAEIVLGNKDWMMCAACSAGPSFEGGGIEFGTRAIPGAIEDFSIDMINFEPKLKIIGDLLPIGICGSGLIAIIAVMFESGIINSIGKFNHDLPTNRIRQKNSIYEYVVAWSNESQIDRDIVITEADIDNCIRAKGAIFSGCISLLSEVGMNIEDIEHVIIAGGFGSYINLEKAISIGLLPEVDFDKITFVGNASLQGAKMSLLANRIRNDVVNVVNKITSLELSEVKSYMNNYVASLFLPHTDMRLFPKLNARLRSKKKNNVI